MEKILKKRKKNPKKQYEKYLDDIWRTVIRLRDKGIDQYKLAMKKETCKGVDAHHIFTRTRKTTRWDVKNGILLSAMHNYSDAHKNPEKFRDFLRGSWFTVEEYDSLYARSQMIAHKIDRSLIELDLLNELKKYTELPEDWNEFSATKKATYLKELRNRH